ncbi:MAG: type II toxin-antitoxin system VapC family toxin [Opitutales bacterium]|nr:type II toxin-antitoxin system VapC family toxin [Opitutales bacterium]
MAYLLDTNVLSELRRGDQGHPEVRNWMGRTLAEGHFISVLSLGEIRRGIESLRRKSPDQAASIEKWLRRLADTYAECLLPITGSVAERWGRLNAERTLPVVDGLLAATAVEFRLTVATRNTADFPKAVPVVNPFEKRRSANPP